MATEKTSPSDVERPQLLPLEWISAAIATARRIEEENSLLERMQNEALARLRHGEGEFACDPSRDGES